ncbi:GGDEF domain-containing protein [Sulfurimonas sp.]|uniref:GGDEF domain-containing protein n=1 Tax=Sulfurimonas sp. TaxID=2022749 RepID=UPI0025DDD2AC|nr:GGDEF domain-containing protein [Sulfurimonas sp.]
MIELFKREDTFKEEIERLWNYRNYIDKTEREENILERTIGVLHSHYKVDSFIVQDSHNNSLLIAKEEGVKFSDNLKTLDEYKHKTSINEESFIYWKNNADKNEDYEKIIQLYFSLLLKRLEKLFTEKNTRHYSVRDSMTGLYNRRFLDEFSAVAEKQHEREKVTYAVLMIDIDHFKSINDKYGHPMGDEVIKSLAFLFKTRIRQSDVVARYGGEEFILLLFNTNVADAVKVANNMLKDFKDMEFTTGEKSFNCSFSCGVDILNEENSNMSNVIRNADIALYSAKNNGRSMTIAFQKEKV